MPKANPWTNHWWRSLPRTIGFVRYAVAALMLLIGFAMAGGMIG